MNKIYSSKEITLQKLQHYCAYQDRSQKQVEKKLYELKCGRQIADEITLELIKSGYLNEERFARSFVRGKFRINHWGKKKIIHELEVHGITGKLVQIALQEISDEEYENEAFKQIISLAQNSKEIDFAAKQKIFRSLYQKGFESELINSLMDQYFIKKW